MSDQSSSAASGATRKPARRTRASAEQKPAAAGATGAKSPDIAALEEQSARIAERVKTAEAAATSARAEVEAAEKASAGHVERLRAEIKAAEETVERLSKALATRLQEAEAASEKAAALHAERLSGETKLAEDAAARLKADIADGVKAAEARIAAGVEAGERAAATFESRVAELLQTTEQATERAATLQQEAVHGMERAGAAVMEGLARAQSEVAEFAAERFRQDIEIQGAYLGCRSLEDVRKVHSRFVRTAMDQYASETQRLMRIGADLMSLPWSRPAH